ncbi:hypothetical protein F751_6508 [Auxenochlorella protothecoides]|uniref:Uncharacterized protein n=1 Tax=Auxenochlorella protothecoides TaxID=3075 RepID=A0A087STD5_AUXPR|nr:hypothetical protein F751_6508 [Auxenochlorella protothecoides]KFM28989.1 hypothetical protein F751_6508 [Auxenochlorella protothecoides]RMZ54873.1 hypothetical protein APUTEX25_000390 [Auxenochlorella protothecoides]|eukprot:RMZ54873.1 hypothetical protein APUTEX25_000390 [Auxenochlorella protothecoides]
MYDHKRHITSTPLCFAGLRIHIKATPGSGSRVEIAATGASGRVNDLWTILQISTVDILPTGAHADLLASTFPIPASAWGCATSFLTLHAPSGNGTGVEGWEDSNPDPAAWAEEVIRRTGCPAPPHLVSTRLLAEEEDVTGGGCRPRLLAFPCSFAAGSRPTSSQPVACALASAGDVPAPPQARVPRQALARIWPNPFW